MLVDVKIPGFVYVFGIPLTCIFILLCYIAFMPEKERVIIVEKPKIISEVKTNVEYRAMPGTTFSQEKSIIDKDATMKQLFPMDKICKLNTSWLDCNDIQTFKTPAYIKTLSGTYKVLYYIRSDTYIHFWEWKSGNLHSGTAFEVLYNEP